MGRKPKTWQVIMLAEAHTLSCRTFRYNLRYILRYNLRYILMYILR